MAQNNGRERCKIRCVPDEHVYTVYLIYLIAKRIFKNEYDALLTALLMCLHPLHFFGPKKNQRVSSAMTEAM